MGPGKGQAGDMGDPLPSATPEPLPKDKSLPSDSVESQENQHPLWSNCWQIPSGYSDYTYLRPLLLGLARILHMGRVGKGTLFVRDCTSVRERFLTRRKSAGFHLFWTPSTWALHGQTTFCPLSIETVSPARICFFHMAGNCECTFPAGFVVNCY